MVALDRDHILERVRREKEGVGGREGRRWEGEREGEMEREETGGKEAEGVGKGVEEEGKGKGEGDGKEGWEGREKEEQIKST